MHGQTEYNFQHLNNDPRTLTITRNSQHSLQFEERIPIYFWIHQDFTRISSIKNKLQSQTQLQFICCDNFADFLKMSQNRQNIIIICSDQMMIDLGENLKSNKSIQKIINFENKFLYQKQLSKQKQIIRIGTYFQLFDIINSIKKQQRTKKDQTNFMLLKDSIKDSSVLINTMYGMLNSETNCEMLADELLKSAKLFTQYERYEQEIKLFVQELKRGTIEPKHALKLYTEQSFLHRIVNSLLRSSRHPTEIFCLQPFFKILFYSVKQIYETNKKWMSFDLCYRGGRITQTEINLLKAHTGEIVQNLGFLSASKKQKQAKRFVQNALFVIQIDNQKRSKGLDFGFAQIHQYSQYEQQQQVLFNPLNTFKISNITQQCQNNLTYCKVYLKYGGLAQILAKDSSQLNKKQKNYKILGQNLSKLYTKINCMGDILINQRQKLQGAKAYWEKFIQLSQINNKQVMLQAYGLFKLANCYKLQNNLDKALKLYNESQQIYGKQLNEQNSDYYATICDHIGVIYCKQCKYRQALQICQTAKEMRQSIGKMDQNYASVLNNLGSIYVSLGDYNKGLEYYGECSQLQKKLIGQFHPNFSITINNIANAHEHLGRFDKAFALYNEAEPLKKWIFGQDSQQYARALNNLGSICRKLKKYQMSHKYYMRCKKLQQVLKGRFSIDYAITLNNIGSLQTQLKNYTLAKQYLSECKLIEQKIFDGNFQYFYLSTLSNLATAQDCLGNHQQSIKLYRQSMNVAQKLYGVNHIEYAAILNNIATTYKNMKEYQKAIDFYEQCLDINRALLGERHPNYTSTLLNLAMTYMSIQQNQKALQLLLKYKQLTQN